MKIVLISGRRIVVGASVDTAALGGMRDPPVTTSGANTYSNDQAPAPSIPRSRTALRQAKSWLGCSP
jgi:hypothetical protein